MPTLQGAAAAAAAAAGSLFQGLQGGLGSRALLLPGAACLALALHLAALAWLCACATARRAPLLRAAARDCARLLLVTAHPDDEAMFFAPLLGALARQPPGARVEVHVLCLTSGEGGGCGEVRARELLGAAAALGIAPARVRVLRHAALRDGLHEAWDGGAAAGAVGEALARVRPALVATFDAEGVTRHPNHCAAHAAVVRAAAAAAADAPPLRPTLLLLQTLPLWQRFLGPLAALCRCRRRAARGTHQQQQQQQQQQLTLGAPGPWPWAHCHQAMRQHASQYVWHRRLWVACSSYSVMNTFDVVAPAPQ
jgi:N-acetylglucosaminylphosphatidylinositol deacetylase